MLSSKWLLSKLYIIFSMHSALDFSFIGYLISTNMASLLWTYEDEKFNTFHVILSMFYRTLQFLIQTLNVNKNYQIKSYGQGRRRRLLWISFQLAVLFKLFIHMRFAKSLWKIEQAVVSNSLFLREVTCCYNRLWELSVAKPASYKDVFVNNIFLLHGDSETL